MKPKHQLAPFLQFDQLSESLKILQILAAIR